MKIDLNSNIKPILAIMVVLFTFIYFSYCAMDKIQPDPQILIAIVGALGTSLGYYFGSSQGSTAKDATIANAMNNPIATTNSGDVTVTPPPVTDPTKTT